MAYDYQRVSRLPVDSRIVRRVSNTPAMMREQGPGFMAQYGGSSRYMVAAKLTKNERIAFYAVQDGFDTPADIAMATGIDESAASRALSGLAKKGFVVPSEQEVMP